MVHRDAKLSGQARQFAESKSKSLGQIPESAPLGEGMMRFPPRQFKRDNGRKGKARKDFLHYAPAALLPKTRAMARAHGAPVRVPAEAQLEERK
jgi:hypothetical protein